MPRVARRARRMPRVARRARRTRVLAWLATPTLLLTGLLGSGTCLLDRRAFAPPVRSIAAAHRRPSVAVAVGINEDDDERRRLARLSDWAFDERGCSGRESVRVDRGRRSKGGGSGVRRGLFATRSHRAGEALLSVPSSAVLVVETEETSDAERGLAFARSIRDEAVVDAFGPYLDALPRIDRPNREWDPTPDCWTEDEIRRLEFPRLVEAALDRKRRVEDLFDRTRTNDDDDDEKFAPTLEELRFATWLVESRSLTLLEEDVADDDDDDDYNNSNNGDETRLLNARTTSVMIPLVDMINHACGGSSEDDRPNAALRVVTVPTNDNDDNENERSYYVVEASRDVAANEEITIAYGSGEESSVELLQYYGFVPTSGNPYDLHMLNWIDEDEEDDVLLTEDEWTTTLEDDEAALRGRRDGGAAADRDAEDMILRFRIRMKRAIREWEELEEYDDDGAEEAV